MATLKASPTEYKGICYRSKSEALFARYLELSGQSFIYEPNFYEADWKPDFLVSRVWSNHLQWFVYEYKPALVTPTYLAKLEEKARIVGGDRLMGVLGVHVYVRVVCFNWYEECGADIFYDYELLYADYDGFLPGGTVTQNLGVDKYFDECKATRFDLHNGGA